MDDLTQTADFSSETSASIEPAISTETPVADTTATNESLDDVWERVS